MGQRNKIYQALDTQMILDSGIISVIILVILWDLLTIRKLYMNITRFNLQFTSKSQFTTV